MGTLRSPSKVLCLTAHDTRDAHIVSSIDAYQRENTRSILCHRLTNDIGAVIDEVMVGGADKGVGADAVEADGQACQREGLAARERKISNAAEAVWQRTQREGRAIFKRVVADAGQAVRQASQRDQGAATEGTG